MLQVPIEQGSSKAGVGCNRAHSCLSGDKDCLCQVVQFLDDTILSVTPAPHIKCSHKMRYRDAFLCTCPVRKEIYKRYRI